MLLDLVNYGFCFLQGKKRYQSFLQWERHSCRSFELKTGSKVECKSFKQTWTDNMTNAVTPEILPYFGEDFTEIIFSVDLNKFNVSIFMKLI